MPRLATGPRARRCLGMSFAAATAVLLACLAGLPASATPVSYFESVGGDLVNNGPGTTFTFDAGLNTIDGTFDFNDFDDFGFVVPDGLQVLAGKVTLTDVPGGGNVTFATWQLRAGSTVVGEGTPVGSLRSASPGFDDLPAPLSAGSYYMNQTSVTMISGGGTGVPTAAYTFVFFAQPVPEPAAAAGLALFAAGTLVLTRRRRRG